MKVSSFHSSLRQGVVPKILLLVLVTVFFLSPATGKDQAQVKRKMVAIKIADLTVSFTTIPAPKPPFYVHPYPLSTIEQVRVKVTNNGAIGSPPAQDFYVDVFLSKTNSYDFSLNTRKPPLLKDGRRIITYLQGGGMKWESNFQVEGKLPGPVPPGEYYLGVAVDTTLKVKESNEGNNTYFLKVIAN